MISFSFSSESFLFPSQGLPGPWVLLKWAVQLLCIWGLPRELPVISDRISSSSEGTGLFCPLRALSADNPRCRGLGGAVGTEGAVGRCACPSPCSSAAHVLRLRWGAAWSCVSGHAGALSWSHARPWKRSPQPTRPMRTQLSGPLPSKVGVPRCPSDDLPVRKRRAFLAPLREHASCGA